MIVYRHADPRFPFLWESADQPAARWHAAGEGPVQYFADSPDGAWAEFLRHEGITEVSDLVNVHRALWAIELPDDLATNEPSLSKRIVTGGYDSYSACQAEARRLRGRGVRVLRAPSAALTAAGARCWKVDGGLQLAFQRDGNVLVLFGPRPDLAGWSVCNVGAPRTDLLNRVRQL